MSAFFRLSSAFALLAILGLCGCGNDQGKDKDKKDKGKVADKHDDHDHKAPHGGQVIELGEHQYHAELCHDDKTGLVTVYVLDKDVKGAVSIAEKEVKINLVVAGQPSTYTLAAKPLDGEPAGKSSRFELTDKKLIEALDADTTKGKLQLSIDGQSFSGDIEHHDDHDHAKEKDGKDKK